MSSKSAIIAGPILDVTRLIPLFQAGVTAISHENPQGQDAAPHSSVVFTWIGPESDVGDLVFV